MTLVGFSGRANDVALGFLSHRELGELLEGMPSQLHWQVIRGAVCPGMLFTSSTVRQDQTGKVSEQLRYRAATIYDFSDLFLVLGADDPVEVASTLRPINMIAEQHRLDILLLDVPMGCIGTLEADGRRMYEGIDLDVIPRYPADINVQSDPDVRRRNLEGAFNVLRNLGVDPSQVMGVRGLEGVTATDIRQRYAGAVTGREVRATGLSAEDQSIVDEFRRHFNVPSGSPAEIADGPLRGRFPDHIEEARTHAIKSNSTTDTPVTRGKVPVSTIHRALRRIQMNTKPKEGKT